MARDDAERWNTRWHDSPGPSEPGPPDTFARLARLFPASGHALEVACGSGRSSVWLAERGMHVVGVDISAVAISAATELAADRGVANRTDFVVHDLDDGLPDGPPADLVLCHLFRDPNLDRPIIERLAPGAMLAIAALSEVDAEPGPFRVRPGALPLAFPEIAPIDCGEANGKAWLIGRLLETSDT